ncbi:lipoate--protein ligase [Balneolaceae bacterium ANBcel3]|nr:lipoate--protein ligase [Balneolaceae bacterium ANBcel3]
MLDLYLIEHPNHHEPAWNLAMEEYVFRNLPDDKEYLLLYRNSPSVIVGRNQNIFEETNLSYLRTANIPVFRRFSGGGTVYHDLGNINFSFHTRYEPSRLHNYRFFNTPIVEMLQKAGVAAAFNERSDILVHGEKISGNAQFSSRGRMISHGTLLFDADVNALRNSLAVHVPYMESKSQKSVRSVVANISDVLPEKLSIEEFEQRFIASLIPEVKLKHQRVNLSEEDYKNIHTLMEEKYLDWEWIYGRNPGFTIRKKLFRGDDWCHMEVRVHKGVIERIHFDPVHQKQPFKLYIGGLKKLTGIRYTDEELELRLCEILGNNTAISKSANRWSTLLFEGEESVQLP